MVDQRERVEEGEGKDPCENASLKRERYKCEKHTNKQDPAQYLRTNIQVDDKVLPRVRPEEQVEVAPCQPQRMVDILRDDDVAVGRDGSLDMEHWTPERLAL